VAVVARQGDWTRVLCSNGWSAWVDGRDLTPLSAASVPAATPAAGHPAVAGHAGLAFSPALIGAAAVALGALLGWTRGQGLGANSLDIPLLSLIDFKASDSAVKVGFLVLGLAAAGVAGSLQPSRAWLKKVAGIGAVVVSVLFIVQIQRVISQIGAGSVFSVLGLGVPLTLAGGLVLIFEEKLGGLLNRSR
jgi:hypothetical protein